MARRHEDFLNAGARLYGISVDSPGQHSAMIDKLRLPFPLLSDPDRSLAVEPFEVADPKDPRELARPSMILVDTDRTEAWRFVSRDFADRLPEEEVLEVVRAHGWAPTRQEPPTIGTPEPGSRAMAVDDLPTYYRGARFAALAMGLRHRALGEEIADDSKAYVAEMDRFIEAVRRLVADSG